VVVKVLFFGAAADVVGSRQFELAADGATTAKSLIDQFAREHPRLANHKLLVAVNEEYADVEALLRDGDEVAIFTAVSGG